MNKNLKRRMKELAASIRLHNRLYHQLNVPLITDHDYDQMVKELRALEEKYPDEAEKDSPTKTVGYKPSSKFKKIKHIKPMLSLSNVFSDEEFKAWDRKITHSLSTFFLSNNTQASLLTPRYQAELKYDGLSLNLLYERHEGKLVLTQALTRGDGRTGEDVIHNVKRVKGIPQVINDTNVTEIEIRGEVVMSFAEFERINADLEAAGKKPYTNARNAAAGCLRTFDTEREVELQFMCYGVGHYTELLSSYTGKTLDNQFDLLQAWGFNTNPDYRWLVTDLQEVVGIYNLVQEMRPDLPFGIDGLVVKINHFVSQVLLGYVSNAPRYAIAWKYPAEEAKTTLEEITEQVGRTGQVTPVARLKPVFVGGVTVTNATLHNLSEIRRKDLRIGDTVIVRRAGDVVPEIVGPVLAMRTGDEVEYTMVDHCPECNTKLEREPGEIEIYRCPAGHECPAQRLGMFLHAVGRKAFNIDGLGDVILGDLVRDGILKKLVDIFWLDENTLNEYVGNKTAKNIIEAIDGARKMPMENFINALGIRHCGEGTSKRLSKKYRNIQQFMDATYLELLELDDIGEKTARSIADYVADAINIMQLIEFQAQLKIDEPVESVMINRKLAGLTFVITGTFEGYDRDQAIEFVESRGGKVVGSVSNKVNYVLAGVGAGGKKLAKAAELKIPIIDFLPKEITTF